MDTILRAVVVYFLLLAMFRLSGKRTLGDLTSFDLILTLIISEAIQQALLDGDNSMTSGFLSVTTLVGLNILISVLKQRWHGFERVLEGVPTVIYDGKWYRDRMDMERVDEADVLTAARHQRGLDSVDEIRLAVIEKDGTVTVIPKRRSVTEV